MKKRYLFILIAMLFTSVILLMMMGEKKKQSPLWEIRSVDTVKYSRDNAWQMLEDPTFDSTIDKQVADIAGLGVSHIAIGTPYDEQFVPYLKRWVEKARKYNLKVWFRGNFSGWEEWFEYDRISREEHKKLLVEFITSNPDLFEDGDIFTSCPECENGGPGDPRFINDSEGHRQFLIEEYKISVDSFSKINKNVQSGFYSMNYDVAKLIMDKETTRSLGGLVVIDHYVNDPKQIAHDAEAIAQASDGEIILGEFGAPIPDINGDMDEVQQAEWIETALEEVRKTNSVIGINYWVNIGGSTKLWNEDGRRRKAADIVSKFFHSTKPISPR